ncbi:hypothetical protein F3087_33660 [Nocardia colli]|uniref:Uncharacterized protein n=1 Tax=Nocardia colli TaxID=2545717 RepID=A0A5N0EAL2_9NOCA|nr:hypothetical protein F3087_33660 [Nocardia colli]
MVADSARCSVLGARCSVLGARCSVLGARCSAVVGRWLAPHLVGDRWLAGWWLAGGLIGWLLVGSTEGRGV